MVERSCHSAHSHQIPPAATVAASNSSNCDGDGDGDGEDDHHQHQHQHQHQYHRVHDVPCHASFFEVAAPSMEFTHSDPSMAIPKAFVKRFRPYLSTTDVKLESPCGRLWNVCLEESVEMEEFEGRPYSSLKITRGWKEFASYMEIQTGDLVIFDLVSKGYFKVYTYEGEDSCEKDIYSKSMMVIEGTSMNEKEIDAEEDVHESEGLPSISSEEELVASDALDHGLSTSDATPDANPPRKKLKSGMTGGHLPHVALPYIQQDFKFKKALLTLDDFWKIWAHFHTETQEAFKAAISFVGSNPFTIILMCHSSVCYGFKVDLPKQFASRYLSKTAKEIALLDKDNKAWTITWLGSESVECSLSGGWKYFAIDHDLRCGDICIFELLPMRENITVFRVHIFKVSPSDVVAIRDTIPTKFSEVLARPS